MVPKLDTGTVRRLIRQELEKSELAGMALSRELEVQSVSAEELERRLKAIPGYRIWWSVDGGVELGDIQIVSVTALENEEQYRVVTRCRLAIARAYEYEPGQPVEENTATVQLVVNPALEVVDFNFRWAGSDEQGH